MKPSFCHLFRNFSVTMEPHCALKVAKHLLDYIRPFLAKADFKRGNAFPGYHRFTFSIIFGDTFTSPK